MSSRRRGRSRVTLLVTAAATVAVAVVAVAAYLTMSRQLRRDAESALVGRAEAAVAANGDPVGLARVSPGALGSVDLRVAVVAGNAEAISADGRAGAPPLDVAELAVAAGELPRSVRTAELDGQAYRVVAVRAGAGRALVVAQSTAVVDVQLRSLRLVLLVVGAGAVLAAAGLGLLLGPRGSEPEQGVGGDGDEEQREVAVGGVEEPERADVPTAALGAPDPAQQSVSLDEEPAAGGERGDPVHPGRGERPQQQ